MSATTKTSVRNPLLELLEIENRNYVVTLIKYTYRDSILLEIANDEEKKDPAAYYPWTHSRREI